MTRSEYQELVEFLGTKFDAIDRRFDAMDRRFDALEGRVARVEVTQEQDRHTIQVLAEGIAAVNERLDRFREEVAADFRSVRTDMSVGFGSVWGEFRIVREEMAQGFKDQAKLIGHFEARVGRLEDRPN